jgi:hypothetical protein
VSRYIDLGIAKPFCSEYFHFFYPTGALMFPFPTFKTLLIPVALLMAQGAAFSAENSVLEIVATPGKTICQSKEQMRGNLPTKAEFCVTQGNFSHDKYQLKIGGNTILKGLDDETTKGISSNYNGEKIQLTCVSKNEAATDISSGQFAAVQKMMPKFSQEEALKAAMLMETVEVGRSCVVQLGNESLIEVLVKFE